jgi:hypothetical protein
MVVRGFAGRSNRIELLDTGAGGFWTTIAVGKKRAFFDINVVEVQDMGPAFSFFTAP